MIRDGYPHRPFITPQFELIRSDLARQGIDRIVRYLGVVGRYGAKDSIETFTGWNTTTNYMHPEPVMLEDGLALLWSTEEFLEGRAHRLTVGDTGEVGYHRKPFNVDCQKIPSDVVRLAGFEAVSANNDAVFGIMAAPQPVMVTAGVRQHVR